MDIYAMVEQMTTDAVDTLFRYATAVPEARREWRPAPTATTVMEILRENAIMPFLLAEVLRQRPQEASDELWVQAERQAGTLNSLASCEQACRAGTAEMLQALRQIRVDELSQQVALPWQMSASLLEAAMVHYWNLVYHLGQVAYIQRLYGDTSYY